MTAPAAASSGSSPLSTLYIGLMSGTSLDGVDGVLASFPPLPADDAPAGAASATSASRASSSHLSPGIATLATAYVPFDDSLRAALMSLQSAGPDEIHREALVAAQLARHYAACVAQLRPHAEGKAIAAVGVHGQTIRHRPELGYTRQTNNPALLAELSGIDVIADFRSRDIAAGGQGAPLVPAFHQAVFGSPRQTRVVVNIGGIGNISILPAADSPDAIGTSGFDTGPGNVLMDGWIARHQNRAYDENGTWAASGKVHEALLKNLLDEAFFAQPAPKSTGRDLFHAAWLERKLQPFASVPAADVQATLAALTAVSIAQAIAEHAPDAAAVYVCGGGAHNGHLMRALAQALVSALQCEPGRAPLVQSTDALGVAPNHVEALAFAWLAQRFVQRRPGNVPAVTGAVGPRVLGALYPA